MPRYRLFATDLDGTLFGHDMVVSERNRRALAALQDRGCALVLATGRMYRATLPTARLLGITTPLITYQGALIRHPEDGPDVWHHTMPPDIAKEAIAALEETGLHVNLYAGDNLYLRRITPEAESYMALARVDATVLDSWDDSRASGPTKLVAIGPEDQIVHWQDVLKARFGDRLFVTQSNPTFLEIADPRVGKGAALAHLAAELGIPREAVVAVGDGLNDLDMIEYAGLGVAMASGNPGLKAKADRVTASLKEDGVAVLIEDLIEAGEI